MPATISLFRLPYCAYVKVLDFITPDEIFKLSFTSKRTYQLLQFTWFTWKKYGNLKLILNGSEPAEIQYDDDCEMYALCRISMELENSGNVRDVRIEFSQIPLFYCNDVGPLYDYCASLFDGGIESLSLSGDVRAYDIAKFTSCIPILYSCDVKLEKTICTLQLPKIKDSLKIHSKLSENFKFAGNFDSGTLKIIHGNWLSSHALLNIQSSLVSIRHSRFMSFDVNYFLKMWKRGLRWHNLKWIKLGLFEYLDLDLEKVFDGIKYKEVDRSIKRSFRMCSEKTLHIPGGFYIKRKDGVLATIFIRHVNEPLAPIFEMVVWPDWSEDQPFYD